MDTSLISRTQCKKLVLKSVYEHSVRSESRDFNVLLSFLKNAHPMVSISEISRVVGQTTRKMGYRNIARILDAGLKSPVAVVVSHPPQKVASMTEEATPSKSQEVQTVVKISARAQKRSFKKGRKPLSKSSSVRDNILDTIDTEEELVSFSLKDSSKPVPMSEGTVNKKFQKTIVPDSGLLIPGNHCATCNKGRCICRRVVFVRPGAKLDEDFSVKKNSQTMGDLANLANEERLTSFKNDAQLLKAARNIFVKRENELVQKVVQKVTAANAIALGSFVNRLEEITMQHMSQQKMGLYKSFIVDGKITARSDFEEASKRLIKTVTTFDKKGKAVITKVHPTFSQEEYPLLYHPLAPVFDPRDFEVQIEYDLGVTTLASAFSKFTSFFTKWFAPKGIGYVRTENSFSTSYTMRQGWRTSFKNDNFNDSFHTLENVNVASAGVQFYGTGANASVINRNSLVNAHSKNHIVNESYFGGETKQEWRFSTATGAVGNIEIHTPVFHHTGKTGYISVSIFDLDENKVTSIPLDSKYSALITEEYKAAARLSVRQVCERAAYKYGLTPGSVSQIRKQLEDLHNFKGYKDNLPVVSQFESLSDSLITFRKLADIIEKNDSSVRSNEDFLKVVRDHNSKNTSGFFSDKSMIHITEPTAMNLFFYGNDYIPSDVANADGKIFLVHKNICNLTKGSKRPATVCFSIVLDHLYSITGKEQLKVTRDWLVGVTDKYRRIHSSWISPIFDEAGISAHEHVANLRLTSQCPADRLSYLVDNGVSFIF